jgi:hypothetical protein
MDEWCNNITVRAFCICISECIPIGLSLKGVFSGGPVDVKFGWGGPVALVDNFVERDKGNMFFC